MQRISMNVELKHLKTVQSVKGMVGLYEMSFIGQVLST